MDYYNIIFEHITIKGNKTSLRWIMNFLMERNISFTWDRMTEFLEFVQAYMPENQSKTDLTQIIENCPSTGWDIVNQFSCSYVDILNR